MTIETKVLLYRVTGLFLAKSKFCGFYKDAQYLPCHANIVVYFRIFNFIWIICKNLL